MTATQEATLVTLEDISWFDSAKHCQVRSGTIQSVIDDYAELKTDGSDFPPVTCYSDGKSIWLVDGFHRCEAAMAINLTEIPAIIHEGSLRDAILAAVKANADHGLNRTVEDKRRAVMTLLNDDTWRKWSAREIARRCGVSNKFVSALKRGLSVSGKQIDEPVTCERNGTTYEMQTANIGAKPDAPTQEDRPLPPEPSSVPGELTEWSPDEANEEAPQSFVDEPEPPNENRIGYFHKTLNGQLDQFIAMRDYPTLLTIREHLDMATEKVGLAMDELKGDE